ncbi:hypothetical protein GTP44_07150 [Duganella sp. FT50W]|uniref:Uncharacterized protein n=1 Tax=Duganella lactea TaxID=2692173 RepID=A0A6L8MGS8_9BURK|nr:hypothetical protein [Duganella lactea]MYM81734.1 hypothetical protein [Duganella lactea]
MDQHKLRALVFEKTGVRIDIDDPVFALVALNEAVLEEAVERHIARIDAASRQLAAQAGHAAAPAATAAPAIAPRELRLLGAACVIALISALVVLGGQAALRQPGLSSEQEQALRRAARLEQAIQQLDPRARAQLQAELQK